MAGDFRFQISNFGFRILAGGAAHPASIENRQSKIEGSFS
jgi:hypothetical protein